jgi:hypothetical protein
MKLDSKYFDSLRSTTESRKARRSEEAQPCQWMGCSEKASHRAPMGRGREGRYYRFCFEHARQFNANYNYFQGMSDTEVEGYLKESVTGHRPTWRMGNDPAIGRGGSRRRPATANGGFEGEDAHELLDEGPPARRTAARNRPVRPLERKALDQLGLPDTAEREQIKARFKELVKRHHPDANGGDKRSEDRLREIIQAYNYLKQAGLV